MLIQKQMAAVRRRYRHQPPATERQWSTFVLDQATALYEDNEDGVTDDDELQVDEANPVQQGAITKDAGAEEAGAEVAGEEVASEEETSNDESSEEEASEVDSQEDEYDG